MFIFKEPKSDDEFSELAIFLLVIGLLIAGLIREINKFTGVPYTPMLFAAGLGMGMLSDSLGVVGKAVETVGFVHP
jgi:hypothetical protein